MVRAAGRVAIWALVLLVFVRGLGDVLGSESDQHQSSSNPVGGAHSVRAFAVTLARAYLGGGHTIQRYAPEGLSMPASGTPGRSLVAATVAGQRRLSAARWLITVACELAGRAGTRYLAVPVQRGDRGSLSMFALPAVVAGPAAVKLDVEKPQPLEGPAAGSIGRLVERFVARYLSGDARGELAYLTLLGNQLRTPGGLELVDVERIGQASEPDGRRLVVVAEVIGRDPATYSVYPLAYRLELVRRDRWYVASVQGALG
ncbi:MAG: hypothetical protein QOD71_453 [Thermoleophilaceae bacterium]|jgi:hypothetical protein|nr:hypothetical protein [Thermoleophilaceae bacterium]